MLFHIKQTHAPHDCPYAKGDRRLALRRRIEGRQDPRLPGWRSRSATYLVVETDDIVHLQKFLRPGRR